MMAEGSDLGWSANPTPAGRLSSGYLNRLLDLIPEDPDIYRRFLLAAQLGLPPSTLVHPRVVARVATHPARGTPPSGRRNR